MLSCYKNSTTTAFKNMDVLSVDEGKKDDEKVAEQKGRKRKNPNCQNKTN